MGEQALHPQLSYISKNTGALNGVIAVLRIHRLNITTSSKMQYVSAFKCREIHPTPIALREAIGGVIAVTWIGGRR